MHQTSIPISRLPEHPHYRRLHGIAGLHVDLRYASSRNLLGRDLYSPHDCAWLHEQAADALAQAVQHLATEAPGLRLCVLDAVRPQRVQELFWAHVRGTPMQRYFADPARGSIHSFGMAVDLTLVDTNGQELDMGTAFDDTTEGSHPALESALVAEGRLSPAQVACRQQLRRVMAAAGWQGIDTEWWHFDCGDRDEVRRHWPRVV